MAAAPTDPPAAPDPPWRFAAAAVGGLAALAAVKFWPLLRPWERVTFGGDLSLGIEGHFYGLLKRGIVWLWDPTMVTGDLVIGGGTHIPFSTPALFHLFYPPGMLVFGLAEHDREIPHFVLVCFMVAHFVAAGVFTVAYTRALGVGRAGAFLAGATFMLSTGLLAHFAHWHMVASVAWLPLALLGIERLLARPTPAGAALAALPLAMSLLAGHPQAFVYVALAVGLAALWGLGGIVAEAGSVRPALAALRAPVAALGATAGLACALAAILLLPMIEMRAWARQPPEIYGFDWKTQGSLPPSQLPKLLLPNAMTLIGGVHHSETALYLGVLPLVLGVVGAATARSRAARFHVGLALLAFLLAFGSFTPFYRLAYDLVPGVGTNRIPGRTLLLATLSLSVLAGFGLDRLTARARAGRRTSVRAARAVSRILAVAAVFTGAVAGGRLLGLEAAPGIDQLLTDLVVLTVLLAASLAALRVAARGAPARVVARVILGVALADLLFWGSVFSDGERSPDEARRDNPDVVAFLQQDPSRFRLGLRDTAAIAVSHLYRNNWPVYDEESRLLEPAVEDLYFLAATNPRVIDLLGVKYVIGGRRPTVPPTKYASLDVSAEVSEKTVPLAGLPPVSTIALVSRLGAARDVPQGATVATIVLEAAAGPPLVLPIRAGIETAEWAWDHPLLPPPRHARVAIARTWTVAGEGVPGHDYAARWSLERPIAPVGVRLQYLNPEGSLAVPSLKLDATEVATLETRFRLVHRAVEENRHALPPAFLVPAVRLVADRAARLDLMVRFDPEALAVLSAAPPGLDLAALAASRPLETDEGATLTEARWFQARIRANARHPRLLVLSDTWSRWWTATDNGRPVPVLVVDHALRGLALGPGAHDVVLSFRYPVFSAGVALTLTGWAAVGVVLWRARRRRGPN